MKTVGFFEAKTHLSAFLSQVEKGESFEIVRRGVPVARLVPISLRRENPKKIAQEIRKLRKGVILGNIKLNNLVREGRS